jgi:hypothetical protein
MENPKHETRNPNAKCDSKKKANRESRNAGIS